MAYAEEEAASSVVHGRLRDGEQVAAENTVREIVTGLGDVLVSNVRVMWSYLRRPDIVTEIAFADVIELAEQEGAIKVTAISPSLAALPVDLRPQGNRNAEVDGIFIYGEAEQIRDAIFAGVEDHSPAWAVVRQAAERFEAAQSVPVAAWATCPLCEGQLAARFAHAVQCRECECCFSDAAFAPTLSDRPNYGRLVGEEPWAPLFATQVSVADRRKAWIVKPIEYGGEPACLPDIELDVRARRTRD